MTEEMGLLTFPRNRQSHWRRRRDFLRQSSSVGKQLPGKLDHRWLKNGCARRNWWCRSRAETLTTLTEEGWWNSSARYGRAVWSKHI